MNDNKLEHHLRNNVRTFDLIGFKGSDGISKLIIHFERKAIKNKHIHVYPGISHIGMVVEGNHLLQFIEYIPPNLANAIRTNGLYLFESTATGPLIDKVPDICGKYHFGAQLRDLQSVITNYKGKIFHSAKLFDINQIQLMKLAQFINEYNYRPYEKSLRSLMGSICRCLKKTDVTDEVFCSELVTRALQRCDILPSSVNPERVVPLDYYSNPQDRTITLDVDKEIPLIYGEPSRLK